MAKDDDTKALIKQVHIFLNLSYTLIGITILAMVFYTIDPTQFRFSSEPDLISEMPTEVLDPDLIVNGIHLRTGLIEAEGMFLVVNNCTNCHSAKLVTQNRMNTERWNETIKWMQETQGLWDLGDSQEIIVNYLVTNYPSKKSNVRRMKLTDIDWYELED